MKRIKEHSQTLELAAFKVAEDRSKSNAQKVSAIRKMGFTGLEAGDIILAAMK